MEVKQNIERERDRVNSFKNYLMNKDMNKTSYLNNRRERMDEIKGMKQSLIHQAAHDISLKQKMKDFNLTM